MHAGTLWQAVMARDAGWDAAFVYGVRSTGIYCRPSCPSRRPRRQMVAFFPTPQSAEGAGFRACRRCRPADPPGDRRLETIRRACEYLATPHDRQPTLKTLAAHCAMSPYHLQRTFKQIVGISPREYADACRMGRFKARIKKGEAVTEAMYEAGYGSSSRLYSNAAEKLGMTPAVYRRGGVGQRIRYTLVDSTLGRLLVAATERGVCAVKLGDDDSLLETGLREEYPAAEVRRDDVSLRQWAVALLDRLEGATPDVHLPVDVRASAFQWRVWRYLCTILYGTTQSGWRDRAGDRAADGGARRGTRLCHQSGRRRDSLSSGGPRQRRSRRIPMGSRSKADADSARGCGEQWAASGWTAAALNQSLHPVARKTRAPGRQAGRHRLGHPGPGARRAGLRHYAADPHWRRLPDAGGALRRRVAIPEPDRHDALSLRRRRLQVFCGAAAASRAGIADDPVSATRPDRKSLGRAPAVARPLSAGFENFLTSSCSPASAMPSIESKNSRWTGFTLVITPSLGSAIDASLRISPLADIPISRTAIVCERSIRRRQRGSPNSLLKFPIERITVNFLARTAAIISFVVVFPALPVTPTMGPPHCRLTNRARFCRASTVDFTRTTPKVDEGSITPASTTLPAACFSTACFRKS